MLKNHPGLKLLLIGGLFGLAFGLSYWFLWGCRNCAKNNNPIALIGLCVAVGAGMARAWGMDHLHYRR